jgi:hypothetical protein
MTICNLEDCDKVATHGTSSSRNTHCFTHKEKEMQITFVYEDYSKIPFINLDKKNRICIYDDCTTQAIYNFTGNNQRKFCTKHRFDGMVDVASKRCKCGKAQPIFGHPGSKAICCKLCAEPGMIDRKNKICIVCNKTRAGYNFPGLDKKYCVKHKLQGMVDLVNK